MTDAEAFLLDLPRFAHAGAGAYAPGLDRVRALLSAMGDPHLTPPTVHVAGTNGKGSTASFVAAIGTASGKRVGLHTSPHLLSLRERMRVDGAPAPADWLDEAVEGFTGAMLDIGPSFFEATVALSLLYFREMEVDLAVVEVGLGGRLDATTVVQPLACGVTHIGLDHTDLLGSTLAEIAREKAGIAKAGVPFLHTVQGGSAALEAEARKRAAPVERVRQSVRVDHAAHTTLHTPRGMYGPVRLGLAGTHQQWNAALAVRLAETALPGVDRQSVEVGLRDVTHLAGLRGRGEAWSVDPRIRLDVAHNPEGWRAALHGIEETDGALWVLVGAMRDKDISALRPLLNARGARVWTVGLAGERAESAENLAALLGGRPARGVAAVLGQFRREAGPQDRLLVTGSHVAVAEALSALEDERT